jgi:DNA repair protein RadC
VTKILIKSGEIIGINVLDHVIVGNEDNLSFSDIGLLDGND